MAVADVDASRRALSDRELAAALVPDRSLAQRMDALGRANKIRTRRARLKRDMKAGRADVLELLREPPEYVETMKLYDLLLAMPRFGRVRVQTILRSVVVSPSKTLGGLSERQRGELIGLIRRLLEVADARREDRHGNVPARVREAARR